MSDSAGKPIRGAMVKATAGTKTVTRFTRTDGRYEITVAAGKYDVSAEAFGFAVADQSKDAAETDQTNFTLTPRMDLARLSGAELEGLLPDNTETKSLRANCTGCHTMHTMMKGRGMTAEWFRNFLPRMTGNVGRVGEWTGGGILLRHHAQSLFTPEAIATLADILEKYLGPNAPDWGPHATPSLDRVKHAYPADQALRATFNEYTIPTEQPMAHSLTLDPVRGYAWFGEQSSKANKIGRFDIKTETFQEYIVPSPNSAPHTGVVDKDGTFWISLAGRSPVSIAAVDPTTGRITEYTWTDRKGPVDRAHTLSFDPSGNLFISHLSVAEMWTFDMKTKQYAAVKYPAATKYPEESLGNWEDIKGQPLEAVQVGSYDVAADSKGTLWFTEGDMGKLVSMDRATGEISEYKAPGTISTKGVLVDAQDNIWFSNFVGHTLEKLDQKTGNIKQYRPPTRNASFYGITLEKRTGYIWCADSNGNNITRFDPKTEQFVEYPIPTADAFPRFINVDPNTGKVWFTEFFQGKIGLLDPGSSNAQISSGR